MVGGVAGLLPSAISRIVLRRIFPDRVLGRAATMSTSPQRRHGADLVADPLHELGPDPLPVGLGVDPGLEHDQPSRDLALELVGDADDRAFGDVGMTGERRLHRPGREPVPGDVEDVVGTAHDVEVAVLVEVAAVAGQVVAVERRQVRRDVPVVVAPQGRQRAGRHRQPEADRPLDARRRPASPSRRGPCTSYPGTGTDGEPGLIGSVSSPRRLAAIGQPVSVCHQLSMTGTPSRSDAHCYVSGSSRSPARNSVRSDGEVVAAASRAPAGPPS